MVGRSLAKRYASEIYQALKLWAAWPPDEPCDLGVVGRVDGAVFQPELTLNELGVTDVGVSAQESSSSRIYATAGAVGVHIGGELHAPVPPVGADGAVVVSVEFAAQHSIFMALGGCRSHHITNLSKVAGAIRRLDTHGKWDRRWHVVTSVTTTAAGVVAVAHARGAQLQLEVNGSFPSLTDALAAGVGVSLRSARSCAFQCSWESEATPLMSLRRLAPGNPMAALRGEPAVALDPMASPLDLWFVEAEPDQLTGD